MALSLSIYLMGTCPMQYLRHTYTKKKSVYLNLTWCLYSVFYLAALCFCMFPVRVDHREILGRFGGWKGSSSIL